jgi:hypothetical protein
MQALQSVAVAPAALLPLREAAGLMRFAIVDPPYLGLAESFYGHLHAEAAEYDKLETHAKLIESLAAYDGWALHMTSGNLHDILPLCPKDARVMAWVKPFASFKPGIVGAHSAWEPVIVRGGRRHPRLHAVRDWIAESAALKKELRGAKPMAVVWWLLNVLNAEPDDEILDLFPGSGAVTRAIQGWREAKTGVCTLPLFA